MNLCKTLEHNDMVLVFSDLQNPILETLAMLYTYQGEKDPSTSKSVNAANCSNFEYLDELHMLDMAAAIHMHFEARPW